jgi:cytochrome c biogenesis protein CcdA
MSLTKKIVLIALGVSLVIGLISYLLDGGGTTFQTGEYIIYTSVISFMEVALLFVIGFVVLIAKINGPSLKLKDGDDLLDSLKEQRMNHKEVARSFFLAGGLILLIGTSLCFGGFFGSY